MPEVIQFKNLVDLLNKSVERFASNQLFGTKTNGQWVWTKYSEFGALVDQFRAGLASLGVGNGDRVAVISDNRVEWAVGAYASYGLGACYVPMYQKQHPNDWEYILRDSGAKVVLAANGDITAKVRPYIDKVDTLEAVVDFEGAASDPHSYASLLAVGKGAPVPPADPASSDLCGFIYTSGTTGNPKGVKLSHGNICSNVNAVQHFFPMGSSDRSLSFLPWAHSFGQTVELHLMLSYGAEVAINEAVETLIANLPEVQPTVLVSVPRIWNRIYDGLNKKIAEGSPVKRAMFHAALANAARRRELAAAGSSSFGAELKQKIFDKLVFSKVRARLGGRLAYAISGGAALSQEVAQFINDVGITVFEGYGLSETSPIATANRPGHQRIGSVGKAIMDVEILIDTDIIDGELGEVGEIIIKGPNVMQGYHNLDEETASVIREDGSFRTGDLGRLDADGYLWITGRLKEQYKLENGKYVVPSPLEEQLALSGFINQIMIQGANKLYNVAIIVPDEAAVMGWAKNAGLSGDFRSLLADPKVHELFQGEIDKYGQSVFKGYERVKKFRLVPDEFTTDNEMLTPSMKVKRRNVLKAYQHLIDEMYGEAS